MPQLKMAESTIMQEKSQTPPRNGSDTQSPPSRNLEKNLSRHIKHLFEDFSRTRPDLLSFLFSTNYFSTPPPPGVFQKKKFFKIFTPEPQLAPEVEFEPTGTYLPTAVL